jgi:hypothetical protein
MEITGNKINKSIPMDPNHIKRIHNLMADHLRTEGKPISFGEATRQLIDIGLKHIDLLEKAGE